MVNKILSEHGRKSKKNKQTNENLKSQVPKPQKLRQELIQIMNKKFIFTIIDSLESFFFSRTTVIQHFLYLLLKLGIELDQ